MDVKVFGFLKQNYKILLVKKTQFITYNMTRLIPFPGYKKLGKRVLPPEIYNQHDKLENLFNTIPLPFLTRYQLVIQTVII